MSFRVNLEKMSAKDLAIVIHHLEGKREGAEHLESVAQTLYKDLLQQARKISVCNCSLMATDYFQARSLSSSKISDVQLKGILQSLAGRSLHLSLFNLILIYYVQSDDITGGPLSGHRMLLRLRLFNFSQLLFRNFF